MATTEPRCCVTHIGHVAGKVWEALSQGSALSMAQLVKAVGEPRDTVMQAVGWLAREGKVAIEDKGRNRLISLVS
jgi:hypothetical protein